MAVNIAGIVSIVVFYVIILLIGIWAGRKKRSSGSQTDENMLAGRNIGVLVGMITLTATWVGGGYINGTAEYMFLYGLYACQAPFGYSISLIIAGIFFAKTMRERNYVTMLDPLNEKYGPAWTSVLFLPALLGEIFWSAAILSALGSTIVVILEIDQNLAIVISALIAVTYTFFGGLYSVAYTDIIQLSCIFVGLLVTIPFAWNHEAVKTLDPSSDDIWGKPDKETAAVYFDDYMLMIFGGIPWQVYFQRVLSSKSPKHTQVMSVVAGFGCILMAVPPAVIGVIAKATDWSNTSYADQLVNGTIAENKASLVLPLVMQHLTPTAVSVIGLGAVSAAVMSSADSSVLSVSSMFMHNVYRPLIHKNASEKELLWVMRFAIVGAAAAATGLGITVESVYALWYLCGDLVFVLLFPVFAQTVHFPSYCNTYGSIVAFILGLILRIGAGESEFNIPPFIKYPYFQELDDGKWKQLFPFRTFAMVVSFIFLRLSSSFFYNIFVRAGFSKKYDILGCFHENGSKQVYELNPKKEEGKDAATAKYNATFQPD